LESVALVEPTNSVTMAKSSARAGDILVALRVEELRSDRSAPRLRRELARLDQGVRLTLRRLHPEIQVLFQSPGAAHLSQCLRLASPQILQSRLSKYYRLWRLPPLHPVGFTIETVGHLPPPMETN